MSGSALRSWLRRQPHPAKVMLDGDPKRIIEVHEGRSKWMDLLATLDAVDSYETVTLLDASGVVLRARKYSPGETEEPEEPTTQEVMDERAFPIAALAAEFRLTFKECLDAMVRAVDAAAQRANVAENAYAQAIVARAHAEAEVIKANATPPEENNQTTQLLSQFMGGVAAGKQTNGQGQ